MRGAATQDRLRRWRARHIATKPVNTNRNTARAWWMYGGWSVNASSSTNELPAKVPMSADHPNANSLTATERE